MGSALLALLVIQIIHQKNYFVGAVPFSKLAEDICLTPGCVSTASRYVEFADSSVQPCDDFYKYACGKFINNTILTENEKMISDFTIATHRINRQLYSILNEKIEPKGLNYEKQLKLLFQSCMNETENEKIALKTLMEHIDSFGGWPVLEKQMNTTAKCRRNWMTLTKDFRKAGFDFDQIISIGVDFNSTNTAIRNIAVIMPHK